MYYNIVAIVAFFIIFISMQYAINKILMELREIKKILISIRMKEMR